MTYSFSSVSLQLYAETGVEVMKELCHNANVYLGITFASACFHYIKVVEHYVTLS